MNAEHPRMSPTFDSKAPRHNQSHGRYHDEVSSRRRFLQWTSTAALCAAGCGRQPGEERKLYTRTAARGSSAVEGTYATSLLRWGYATGVLGVQRDGRPIKIEGNPEHPMSLGATSAIDQAAILDVYDPRRLKAMTMTHGAEVSDCSWRRFRERVVAGASDGQGLRFLLEPTGSPLRAALLRELLRSFPAAKICTFSPFRPNSVRIATQKLAGRALQAHTNLQHADCIFSLDADFLDQSPAALRNCRHFANRRRVEGEASTMNRLYLVECKPTVTGSMADQRFSSKNARVASIAAAVLQELAQALPSSGFDGLHLRLGSIELDARERGFVARVAADLVRHRDRALVVVGDRQPWFVHVLAHVANAALGAIPKLVYYTSDILLDANPARVGVEELFDEIDAGEIDTIVVEGGDPVRTLPPKLDVIEGFRRIENSIYWGTLPSQTSELCRFVVPGTHPLEAWGDSAAYDGTISFQQPLIRSSDRACTLDQLLALFAGRRDLPSARELLWQKWSDGHVGGDSLEQLQTGLERGFLADSQSEVSHIPSISRAVIDDAIAALQVAQRTEAELELALYESPCISDGSMAHNPWLQELPDPITKLTWGNALMLSPNTASSMGSSDGDVVEVRVNGRTVRGPVLTVPTHAEHAISAYVGYGASLPVFHDYPNSKNNAASPVGFDVYQSRASLD